MYKYLFLILFFCFSNNHLMADVCKEYFEKIGYANYKWKKEDITEIALSYSRDPSKEEFKICKNARYSQPGQFMNFFCDERVVGRTTFGVWGDSKPINYIIHDGNIWKVGHIQKRRQEGSQNCQKVSDNLYTRESEKTILHMSLLTDPRVYHVRKNYTLWRYSNDKKILDKDPIPSAIENYEQWKEN